MTKEDCIKRRLETSLGKYSPDLLLTPVLQKRNKTTYDIKPSKAKPTQEDLSTKHSQRQM